MGDDFGLFGRDPNLKIGLFSSYGDSVVANVVGMDSSLYRHTLLNETEKLRVAHPNTFKRYIVKGDSHTLGDFYRKVEGVTVWDWLTYMIENNPKWDDVIQ